MDVEDGCIPVNWLKELDALLNSIPVPPSHCYLKLGLKPEVWMEITLNWQTIPMDRIELDIRHSMEGYFPLITPDSTTFGYTVSYFIT
jgi:hypothetical protein